MSRALTEILRKCVGVCSIAACGAFAAPTDSPVDSGSSARELFNNGTRMLQHAQLTEAEVLLERAVATQDEPVQAPALYNLAHVRVIEGAEELKKGPSARQLTSAANSLDAHADAAIRAADESLASEDLQKMVTAYMNGRGVRKELKAATLAVSRALESYGVTLNKWQRASGDFKSAAELKQSDTDARENAAVVERSIARLIDSIREMQKCSGGMCDKKKQLEDKLKQLKGRIPASQMPPGSAGDDPEDDDFPLGKNPNEKEAPTKQGKEISLPPELAGWLLDMFKLSSERRLPMGQQGTAEPKDPSRPTW